LSRDDLIQLEGVLARLLGRGIGEVECENKVIIRGVLCARMKKRRIKVMKGSRGQAEGEKIGIE